MQSSDSLCLSKQTGVVNLWKPVMAVQVKWADSGQTTSNKVISIDSNETKNKTQSPTKFSPKMNLKEQIP